MILVNLLKKMYVFLCRNVATGAHYHFVSRWTSSSAYIAASLVMMVFVSRLDLQVEQCLNKISKVSYSSGLRSYSVRS